jgi:PPK2 family polyphosphate:nucleotide phosphotransferase
MKKPALLRTSRLVEPYRVTNGRTFRLADYDPDDTGTLKKEDKPRSRDALARGVEELYRQQEMLYAQDRWSVLLIFQAMDAAGKDSAIKHVMSGLNPQGTQVASFKQPSVQELEHDYLWRCQKELPARGNFGIFNRSYYEEVLVVRVHDEILANEKLPPALIDKNIWQRRYEDICAFERHLHNNGTIVRKFFLHVSKKEQKRRFLARIEDPKKQWKFSSADVHERALWKEYMSAYQEMIRGTATKHAPWFVVPADNKWYTRIVVAAAVLDALESVELAFPELDKKQRAELAVAKKALLDED